MSFFVLFKQDLRNLINNPANIIMFTIFPIVIITLLGFLFENMYQASFVSSYDFYGVTMMFFVSMMGSTLPANAFLEKRLKKANIRIFYSPVSRVQVYLSKLISCFLFITILLTIEILLLNWIGFVNFGGANVGYIILMLSAMILFFTTLGGAICVSIRSEEITNVILSNSMAVFALLSGIMFPIASLGKWVDKISNISPLKWCLNSVFEMIYNGTSQHYLVIIIGLIILSILLLVIIHKNYKPEDYI